MQHVLVFRCGKAKQFHAVVLLLLLGSFPAFGQQDNLDRDYEPVVITGNQLTDFITTSTSQLFLYKYTAATGSWEQIPFQFDDVDGSGTYFGEADGLLDANDELAFMAKDMGDRAPNYSWIDDANSRNYHRYEITVTDGTDADKKAWAYLYRSNTLTYTPTTDYISANAGADQISSANYQVGHTGNGILDAVTITTTGGGNNADIMDRQKVRIKGELFNGAVSYEMTEDVLSKLNLQFKDGPVRVLRQITLYLAAAGASTSTSISERYYERMSVTGGGSGTLDPSYGVTYMRQSNDLNSAAAGMSFYNNYNSGITINGSPDSPNTTVPSPGLLWGLFTGSQGSLVQLVDLPALGNPQSLYYYDNAAGGTGDDTEDSGDGASYGDVGVKFENPSTGTFALGNTTFYLPANQPGSTGIEMANLYENPLDLSSTSQNPPTYISGNVSGTWTLANSPYVVNGNITVPDAQYLSIEAGVEVRFAGNYSFTIAGKLEAVGAPSDHVFFSSGKPTIAAGDWQYLYFSGADAGTRLEYCDISYGGGYSSIGQVYIQNSGTNVSFSQCTIANGQYEGVRLANSSPSISNCTVSGNSGIGILCADASSDPMISACTISNNDNYAISLFVNTIPNIIVGTTITGNTKNAIEVKQEYVATAAWKDHEVPYVVTNNLCIQDGQVLTVEPGVEVRFAVGWNFQVLGRLVANGTAENHIVFTSDAASPSPGDWSGLNFDNCDAGTSLSYCDVSYGGIGGGMGGGYMTINDRYGNVTILNSGTNVSMTNCCFTHCGYDGIFIKNSSPSVANSSSSDNVRYGVHCGNETAHFSSFDGCTITDNGSFAIRVFVNTVKDLTGTVSISSNAKDSIEVAGSAKFGDTNAIQTGTWRNVGTPYVITGDQRIPDGQTLTIEPGVDLRFNRDLVFQVKGKLVAEGTATNHITFAPNASSPIAGFWYGINLDGCDSGSSLEYCDVSYSGTTSSWGSSWMNVKSTLGMISVFDSGSNLSISDCNLSNSAYDGLYVQNSSPSAINCSMHDNARYGIHLNGGSSTLRGNLIRNDQEGIRVASGTPIFGTTSHWGQNTISDNSSYEAYNNTSNPISAERNYWVATDAATIDSYIYDDNEASKGAVDFDPWLTEDKSLDHTTETPILTTPANNSRDNASLAVDFTLPENALAGTVKLIFTATSGSDPNSPHIYTLASSRETYGNHSFQIDIDNDVTDDPDIASSNHSGTGDALVDGVVYDVTLEYQDDFENAAASVTNSGFTYDVTAPQFTNTFPTTGSVMPNTNVSYTLNETLASGFITWTHTGGPEDANSPHVQALVGAELTAGEHTNITLTNDPTLVWSAGYTVVFEGVDLAGNSAAPTTVTNVYYGAAGDVTPPAVITDLSVVTVTSSSVTLTWTAPGDDGATGTATTYDVRYSNSPIDDSNWDSATHATDEPTPQVAGSTETFTVHPANEYLIL